MQVIKLTGDSATVTAMRQLAFPRVVHFATHGYVAEGEATSGSAGLVLSGANNINHAITPGATSDAYLDADQIRKLDLFACDLVVLSACRTARSTSGTGQSEIIQAFKEAGVGQVIASSWAVPDECTAMLMDYFYEYYIRGVSASQALAEAQRKVATRFPNKRDWAAFMVYE
jgi:CHAT domain-containing protein